VSQRRVAGLNTVSSGDDDTGGGAVHHVVLLHGCGGGVAHWLPTFDFLARLPPAAGCRRVAVHAVDMPGFGRSDRAEPGDDDASAADTAAAMRYVSQRLAAWCCAAGLVATKGASPLSAMPRDADFEASGDDGDAAEEEDEDASQTFVPREVRPARGSRVDVVGHSFGAFCAAHFAVAYPRLVSTLVLADPWGVDAAPPAELADAQAQQRASQALADLGSPFRALRRAGPLGPSLMPSLHGDLARRWQPIVGDVQLFLDYTYHCNAQPGCDGEARFDACCDGGAPFAAEPLLAFLPDALPPSVELRLIYGAATWMPRDAGQAMADLWSARARPERRERTRAAAVEGAGHHVMADNPAAFNEALALALIAKP
jgi:pimeloyl-ACP methyl ester carboxylesterase